MLEEQNAGVILEWFSELVLLACSVWGGDADLVPPLESADWSADVNLTEFTAGGASVQSAKSSRSRDRPHLMQTYGLGQCLLLARSGRIEILMDKKGQSFEGGSLTG
ncbi:hypothetical protein QQP08_023061 [Theobroma cacao]|nr:hypothetical protein QQP08_023061 [Theobroma cacao]